MTPEEGATLLQLARGALGEALDGPAVTIPQQAFLWAPGAVFVTLRQGGELRGCIGSVVVHRALGEDVVSNARAAAFRDPRFPPLRADELERTSIEISVLTPPEPLAVTSEDDACRKVRPGVDGLILRWRHHAGTFIPEMWHQLPNAPTFLRYLKRKAGLPADFWADDVRLERFTAEVVREGGASS